jgi:hypothetical protein
MTGTIEYVDVDYDVEMYQSIYEDLKKTRFSTFVECDISSWLIKSHPKYEGIMQPILQEHKKVHPDICPLATGFNYSPEARVPYHIPAHIDLDKPLFFNLLLPITGCAKITVYKTVINDLEYRHNKSHFMVPKNNNANLEEVKTVVVDRPVLLNTNILHRVHITEAPRNAWCTRWINIPGTFTFDSFKDHVEKTLSSTREQQYVQA